MRNVRTGPLVIPSIVGNETQQDEAQTTEVINNICEGLLVRRHNKQFI
jgi:hypothetical protein